MFDTISKPTDGTLKLTRRRLMQLGFAAGMGALPGIGAMRAIAQETGELAALQRFPRMMQEYYVRWVRKLDETHRERIEALNTKEDAEAYIRSVRERVRESFGPFPEKTPLNPRITGGVDRGAYRIENVIFESLPGFLVTANLYLPGNLSAPVPGVVGSCGHSSNGKAIEAYQAFAQGLARLGYAVLLFDPIGQGERFQYPDEQGRSRYGAGVREHLQAGNQQFLVGEFLGTWRAWDGIRALDYLVTRDEVDPTHVGITGNSGGGTMTTWLCGLEDRWTMAAPSCFVTSFRRNLENELPADTEQCPPRALALGLDHCDFIAAMAPKPAILLGQELDYFDARGLEEAYRRLKRIYRLLGAEENIELFIGPRGHGYSQENREAMYRWFNRATQVSDAQTEPELTYEEESTLLCTPTGQVADMDSRTVFYYTREASRRLASKRHVFDGEALRQAVVETLKLPPREGVPEYRILRAITPRQHPKRFFTTFAIETDPGAQAIVYYLRDDRWYSRPPRAGERALLYVSHLSSDMELRTEERLLTLIEEAPDEALFTCDVRGIGESLPNTCGADFSNPYGPDYFYAIHAIMLDYPYTGQKTYDVLRVLDWLEAYGYTKIHLVGNGYGSYPAIYAALLHGAVDQITLIDSADSYAQLAETEDYQAPLSVLLPDVLKRFDLPECYEALRDKGLNRI